MNDPLSILGLAFTILLTIWVARHYYERAKDKSLTPYMQVAQSLFEGLGPSVRKALKVEFNGAPVDELVRLQYLIANTGELPIRDVITPLALALPDGCTLIDASILDVSPKGRDIQIVLTEAGVQFVFPLLNAKEFFITRLLIRGKAQPHDFSFTITMDEIPPTLEVKELPDKLIRSDIMRRFDWVMLCIGMIFGLFGCAAALLISSEWPYALIASSGFRTAMRTHLFTMLSCIVLAAPALTMLVCSPLCVLGALTDFRRRRRYYVPQGFKRGSAI